jgi:uncharacterized protein (UPF0332 family)
MDATEFIQFSGTITKAGKAGARSSVSRAYYGAFHLALSLLDELGCQIPGNAGAHNLAPECLSCSSNADAKNAARLLSDLHADRIKVDYRPNDARIETVKFAEAAVLRAETIRTSLEAFKKACSDTGVRAEWDAAVAQKKAIRRIP